MFYNTGNDFNVVTGTPDINDPGSSVSNPTGSNFGDFSISGNGIVNLTPISDVSSPFKGVLLYQRRSNTKTASVTGNGNLIGVQGSLYARWALLQTSGNGTTKSQFVVGSMHVNGNGIVTVDPTNTNLGSANLVYLVE